MPDSNERFVEEKLLKSELEKIGSRVNKMNAEERASQIASLRNGLVKMGVVLLRSDEKVFSSFIEGGIALGQLAQHFESRIRVEE